MRLSEDRKIKIGQMRDRIKVERLTKTSDGAGGFSESWSEVGEFWSRVTPRSAKTAFFAMKRDERITHEIIVRHEVDVKSNDRINLGGRLFAIHGVYDARSRGRFKVLDCEEGAAP